MPYSKPLDGIRAVAILAVLVFHVFPNYLPGGFTGVDVFFVLSGFLITSIILRDLREKRFSFREFYLRRIQRLMPNAVVTVLLVLALSSYLLLPSMSRLVGRHALWTLTNLSNFFIWRNLGGYWGNAAEASPLMHTWSLAVEEQFYLVFPASLVLLVRLQPGRVTWWLLMGVGLSLGLCIYATPGHPEAAFYLLPARFWELLLGAVLASTDTPLALSSRLFREAAGWIGLALVLAGFLVIDGNGFPGAIALLPTLGTVLLIVSSTFKTAISRMLSTPFMVGTGRLSYSLYLWHWPLIIFGRLIAVDRGESPVAGALAGAAVSVAVAWLAYVAVEQPLRSRTAGRGWRLAVVAALFTITILTSRSVTKLADIDIAQYFDPPEFQGFLYSVGKVSNAKSVAAAVRFRDVHFSSLEGRVEDSWRSGGIVHAFGGGAPKVVVLGSSHALMYSSVIDSICRKLGVSVAFLGMDGVRLFFDTPANPQVISVREAAEFDSARRHWLETWRPQAVLLIERWDSLFQNRQQFENDLRRFLREVCPTAKTTVFVSQAPVAGDGGDSVNIRELMAVRMRLQNSMPRIFPDHNESIRAQALAVADRAVADFPGLRILRPDRAFYQNDGSVRWSSGRTVYYADDDHLSQAGAELVRGLFEDAIAEAAAYGRKN